MDTNKKVLLIGPGNMGLEYSKVLEGLDVSYDVLGRGKQSADHFYSVTGKSVIRKTVDEYFTQTSSKPTHAIIATDVLSLSKCVLDVMEYGVRNILIEKPAGLSALEISEVVKKAEETGSNVFVAYNRRFYAATERAREIIREDGGVSSFSFEFTEWPNTFLPMYEERQEILRSWFLCNSTHVVDLAFFLGGRPVTMAANVSGGLDWHPQSSIFAGTGVTDRNALFTYQANWEAPGRWGVEVLTKKHRLYFRPMEKLQIQELDSVKISMVELDDTDDVTYKPGLYKETQAFLHARCEDMKTIVEQLSDMELYHIIETGGTINE